MLKRVRGGEVQEATRILVVWETVLSSTPSQLDRFAPNHDSNTLRLNDRSSRKLTALHQSDQKQGTGRDAGLSAGTSRASQPRLPVRPPYPAPLSSIAPSHKTLETPAYSILPCSSLSAWPIRLPPSAFVRSKSGRRQAACNFPPLVRPGTPARAHQVQEIHKRMNHKRRRCIAQPAAACRSTVLSTDARLSRSYGSFLPPPSWSAIPSFTPFKDVLPLYSGSWYRNDHRIRDRSRQIPLEPPDRPLGGRRANRAKHSSHSQMK